MKHEKPFREKTLFIKTDKKGESHGQHNDMII